MPRLSIDFVLGLLLVLSTLPVLGATPPAAREVTLKQIANLDWVGNPPEDAYWGYRGRRIYYWQKRGNEWQERGIPPIRDLYAVDLDNRTVKRVPANELGTVSAPGGAYNLTRTLKVFVRNHNVFVRDLKSGALRQLTRDSTPKSDPGFMADGKHVQWHQSTDIYVYGLASGTLSQAAEIKLTDNPHQPKPPQNYLQAEQLRLFEFLSKRQAGQTAAQNQEHAEVAANSSRAPVPWYLGNQIRVIRSSLSPDGRWLALITIPASYKRGRPGLMPEWITPSGYVETLKVHTYAGLNPPPPQSVLMLNLETHTAFPLNLEQLPGIQDDPLAALRKSAVAWDTSHGIPQTTAEASVRAPAVRAVSVLGIQWSDNGRNVAFMFRSNDNKDRWIATLDFATKTLVTQSRLTNPAWINWSFNAFGWLHNNETLWYLSEASGYSQIYLKGMHANQAHALTAGHYEVSDPALTPDDRYFYFVANKKSPGEYGIYRVNTRNGDMQAITDLAGTNGAQPALNSYGTRTPSQPGYALSPNGQRLLVYHSTIAQPPEVWVVDARPQGTAVQVTHTLSNKFTTVKWIKPRIVEVPSTHVSRPLYARLYLPRNYSPNKTWPAAVNIHEDGYVQDVYDGWPFDLQEALFSAFLAAHGYVVLDMDYRGSAGYGSIWRTAIYQHMGHPEVQDIEDGAHWLEKNWHVNPQHLGVWGHSYGGFLTYMVMFRRPDLFAAGAALSPVGDWADYNGGYTSNILNDPAIDPQAYYVSSAINYADQLKHPLLIAQGLEDDNVFFLDTVHMVERLQELHNLNFNVMFYPTEHHNYRAPYSWLDEYRRIWRLFRTQVSPGTDGAAQN